MDIEDAAREAKLNEQAILQQALEDKDRRIYDLEKKVETLEVMLNRLASVRVAYPQPQAQPLPTYRTPPRRWSPK